MQKKDKPKLWLAVLALMVVFYHHLSFLRVSGGMIHLKTTVSQTVKLAFRRKGGLRLELFLVWFRFFIKTIPNERPVVLLMDSHSSHIGPDVLSLAKENEVYLMTFPAHTSQDVYKRQLLYCTSIVTMDYAHTSKTVV